MEFRKIVCGLLPLLSVSSMASDLVKVSALDNEIIMLTFKDGDVFHLESEPKFVIESEDIAEKSARDSVAWYGKPLDIDKCIKNSSWTISSPDDKSYSGAKINPVKCYRKSKPSGVSQGEWVNDDFTYVIPMEHVIYLKLPYPMQNGKKYQINIPANINSDDKTASVEFNVYTSVSEAVHVNVMGYMQRVEEKNADLYAWLGDGGGRDYSSFEGNKVYLYKPETGEKQLAGSVKFWKKSAPEASKYNFTMCDVWNVDALNTTMTGKCRLVVEGVGCSQDFEISDDIYKHAFDISLVGFYYLRLGEDDSTMVPFPRRPFFITRKRPVQTRVYETTVTPYSECWYNVSKKKTVDGWDTASQWMPYRKPGLPTNDNVKGGHADAKDWDRRLHHVSIIYDMLLPYIVSQGKCADDNSYIPERGNGIPDLIDEARNEVDFWLSLRDGKGYSHGVTNPTKDHAFCQAGETTLAAFANAANASMLAEAFRIMGNEELKNQYLKAAIEAYEYGMLAPESDYFQTEDVGDQRVGVKDMKATAAAYLYNLTGETKYEDMFYQLCETKSADIDLVKRSKYNYLWAAVAYLFTPNKVNYPEFQKILKSSVIKFAKEVEAGYTDIRPTRRATDNDAGYFATEQNMQRTIVAHAISEDIDEKNYFMQAMIREADYGLGRNSLNMIQMGTEYTYLADKRNVEHMYTCGQNDGFYGTHPGQTPYLNLDDWSKLKMAKPSTLYTLCYPKMKAGEYRLWPRAELYFNARYFWAYSEFTPQQTMRGKMALYAYLYGWGKGE